MAADEQANLVLAFAKVLYVNGQATEQTVSAAERLARARGLRATIMPRWGELQLLADDKHGTLIAQAAADPAGVEMDRVASTMRAIEDVGIWPLEARCRCESDRRHRAVAACADMAFHARSSRRSSCISGDLRCPAFLGCDTDICERRRGRHFAPALGQLSANFLLQPFCAAILAGIIGAMAVRYDLSSSLRLVAVCPCMVLVPGPHFLNSALDLINGRIPLGAARLIMPG